MYVNLNNTHLFCTKCGSSNYSRIVVKELLSQVKKKKNFEQVNSYLIKCEACGFQYYKRFAVEKYKLIYFFKEE